MNRVVFLNRFYWPEEPATAQLLADLAEALAADGRPVRVLTSHPGTPDLPAHETHHGVEILRVRSRRASGRGKAAKVLNWMTFMFAALWRVACDTRRGDTLVLLTDPPLLAAVAGPLARWRGAQVVHWVQDIYPELAEVIGGARGLGWMRWLRNRAWRQADACVTPGADMGALVREHGTRGDKIFPIQNWAPRGLVPASKTETALLRHEWRTDNKFVVAYSGNLGRVHDLEPVLELADALRGDPDIVFLFIGDGAQRPRLATLAQARGMPNVRFLPPQPRTRLAASLSAADVHLVTLRADCARLVFPSKLYGTAAVARPVLFIGPPDCEPARLIGSENFGRALRRDDVAQMAATLRTWRDDPVARAEMGRAAENFAAHKASFGQAVAQWRKLLLSLATPSDRPR